MKKLLVTTEFFCGMVDDCLSLWVRIRREAFTPFLELFKARLDGGPGQLCIVGCVPAYGRDLEQ